MKIKILILFLLLCCMRSVVNAQPGATINQRLKVYIDCHTWCDMNYLRSEITIVDFLLDPKAPDVHILINSRNTGGGGEQFELIYFGQNNFKSLSDTLRFSIPATSTNFERREKLVRYIQLGLVPYLVRTRAADDITISMKKKEEAGGLQKDSAGGSPKDPWNYWVFRVGFYGRLNADEVYKSSSYNGDISVSRITDKIKTGVNVNFGKDQTIYTLEDDNGNREKITIRNNNYNFQQFMINSLGPHWSYGYQVGLSRNSFSNNKNRLMLETGVEYNIFPYSQVNTKFFTLSYVIDVRRNHYYDSTLYDKLRETLWGQAFKGKFSFNQKWGNIAIGGEFHNFLSNWKYFNLSAYGECNIRVTGGLSFNIYASAALTRDQLYLPKGGATAQEVLTRRRQIASGYNYFTNVGLNYRFGSKLNNFVNPRFD